MNELKYNDVDLDPQNLKKAIRNRIQVIKITKLISNHLLKDKKKILQNFKSAPKP